MSEINSPLFWIAFGMIIMLMLVAVNSQIQSNIPEIVESQVKEGHWDCKVWVDWTGGYRISKQEAPYKCEDYYQENNDKLICDYGENNRGIFNCGEKAWVKFT